MANMKYVKILVLFLLNQMIAFSQPREAKDLKDRSTSGC